MKKVELKIRNELGIHGPQANKFVEVASVFEAIIAVECDGMKVDGKNMIGLTEIRAHYGKMIVIYANGQDEDKALDALTRLVERDFRE